ncbi:type I-F CRISPR-associated helicase Cas3 [Endozoicomonas sp. (ex Bugula neritina AB1)]|nr:type I-F CRISPR-associated helicase Cas3 [Endozoicomonas sp. (ex Bugula neritina AB1)]
MMVTFVSQCEKNALKKTRRVLDAFANRIGDNTWQTIITQDGLNAVKKLLRKTATKSTAVSCHWIRSRSRSELVWVVGRRDKFGLAGQVPVNTTQRNLIQSTIENDWHYLPLIKALTGLAALFHDWGKATEQFQFKLKPENKQGTKGDPIRHEWISCLLLNAFVQLHQKKVNADDWLIKLVDGEVAEKKLKNYIKRNSPKPLASLPPTAKLLSWLVVSHHRLPLTYDEMRAEEAATIDMTLNRISVAWDYENKRQETETEEDYQARKAACFNFPKGLISQSKPWLKMVKKWSQRLLDCQPLIEQALDDGSYRLILHHARLCLMLGDHHYSSQQAATNWQDTIGLYANTDPASKKLKQKLDEHLVGVARQGLNNAHLLPAFETEPPVACDIASLKKKSPPAYNWQDKAVAEIKRWRKLESESNTGFFVVNAAGTGCGKTIANAKIMRALSKDGNSLRYILALGLRTLTLQTGDEYRHRIGLDDSELAVLIGSRAIQELHNKKQKDLEISHVEATGSESQETLLDEEIDYDCDIPEQGLSTVLREDRDRKFLYAPVLACTIDHIMSATETKRGGRYILPSLRLMSSDLVIDEIDDFTGDDLIAIGRLIHLAGMLGRKVMISSATIPPAMAEGYFKAYRDGWQLYCKTRNASSKIACIWVDEFKTRVTPVSGKKLSDIIPIYRQHHDEFIAQRVQQLTKLPVRRKADIIPCDTLLKVLDKSLTIEEQTTHKKQGYFRCIADNTLIKHAYHSLRDPLTGLHVSFGVVRMANIQPCVELTQYLLEYDWPEDSAARIMAYHSQQTLLMRHQQEKHLDAVLQRKEPDGALPKAFSDPVIQTHLQHIQQHKPTVKHLMFILIATPVEEVGRDHDFDWAIIEPSSFRSFIQLGGRVRRHRQDSVKHPNIGILQYNWKGIKHHHQPDIKVFNHPGFETAIRLASHNVSELIDMGAMAERLDAVPRIQKLNTYTAQRFRNLTETNSLAELEHAATWRWLTDYQEKGPATLQGFLNESWFLTALPQHLTRFRKSEPTLNAYLVYDDNQQTCSFCERNEQGDMVTKERGLNISRQTLNKTAMERLWLERDFEKAIQQLADEQEISPRRLSARYGELNFNYQEGAAYEYSDQLGLVKK